MKKLPEKILFVDVFSQLSEVNCPIYNENFIDTPFKRRHQPNDVEIRPSGTGLSANAAMLSIAFVQQVHSGSLIADIIVANVAIGILVLGY